MRDQRRLQRLFWLGEVQVWAKEYRVGLTMLVVLAILAGAGGWMVHLYRSDAEPAMAITVHLASGYTGRIKVVVDRNKGANVPEVGAVSLNAQGGLVTVTDFTRFARVLSGRDAASSRPQQPIGFVDDQGRPIPWGGTGKAPYAVWFVDSDLASFEVFYVGSSEGWHAELERRRG